MKYILIANLRPLPISFLLCCALSLALSLISKTFFGYDWDTFMFVFFVTLLAVPGVFAWQTLRDWRQVAQITEDKNLDFEDVAFARFVKGWGVSDFDSPEIHYKIGKLSKK